MKRDDLINGIRERLVKLPPPYESHYGVIPMPPIQDSINLGQATYDHGQALTAIARIDTLTHDVGDQFLISRVLPRREALSSSSIEGTHSTLSELLMTEEQKNPASSEAKTVLSYSTILEQQLPLAKEQREEYFSLERICEIQRHVAQNDPECIAKGEIGRLRGKVVWVGGGQHIAYSIYNPPPPARVQACLQENVVYLRKEGDGMSAMAQSIIVRMAIAHVHFEAVHPFVDANGRTGRVLLPLMMAADGHSPIYLSSYIESQKSRYIDALKAGQQRNDYLPMIGYLSNAIVASTEEVLKTREALVRLLQFWESTTEFRKGSAASRALAKLLHYPVITVNRLAELLQLSIPRVNHAIIQLKEAGIVTEKTGYRRNRVFTADAVLMILNRPFGQDPMVEEECGRS